RSHQKDRRKRPLRPRGRRPTRPGDLRRPDRGAHLHGLPVDRRADRRALPDPRVALHRNGPQWFTFTNGTHVDSLDPVTFNRWYDFLQLFVAKRAPILASAGIHAAAPVIYEEAMGIQG